MLKCFRLTKKERKEKKFNQRDGWVNKKINRWMDVQMIKQNKERSSFVNAILPKLQLRERERKNDIVYKDEARTEGIVLLGVRQLNSKACQLINQLVKKPRHLRG